MPTPEKQVRHAVLVSRAGAGTSPDPPRRRGAQPSMRRHALRLLAAAASLGLSAARLPAQNPSPEVEPSASAGFTRGGPL